MQDNLNTYSYGNSLIHTSRKNFFDPTRPHKGVPLPDPQQRTNPILKKTPPETCNIHCDTPSFRTKRSAHDRDRSSDITSQEREPVALDPARWSDYGKSREYVSAAVSRH